MELFVEERLYRGVGVIVWFFTVIKILLLESLELLEFCEFMFDEDLRDLVCGFRRFDFIFLLNISSFVVFVNKVCFKYTYLLKNDFYCV